MAKFLEFGSTKIFKRQKENANTINIWFSKLGLYEGETESLSYRTLLLTKLSFPSDI